MNANDDQSTANSNRTDEVLRSRRGVLKATSGAAVGATALTAATGTVSATGDIELFGNCLGDLPEAPDDAATIDLRSDTPTTGGDFPTGADEILIYVHGWIEDITGGATNQAAALKNALRANGYDAPVVSALWDSNTINWWGVGDTADTAGNRLAGWLDDYLDDHPDTTIRTVNHSLGTRVILQALNELDGAHELEDVALVGGAVDPVTVCDDGGTYEDGIEDSADRVYNYHSTNDNIVCKIYTVAEFSKGVGCEGADCDGWFFKDEEPENYTDVDVSEQVDGHCNYFRPDEGCVPQIVENF